MAWLKKIQKESPSKDGGTDIIGKQEDPFIIEGYKNWVVKFDCKELINRRKQKVGH